MIDLKDRLFSKTRVKPIFQKRIHKVISHEQQREDSQDEYTEENIDFTSKGKGDVYIRDLLTKKKEKVELPKNVVDELKFKDFNHY